jgi:hypothetical protein
VAPIPGLTDIAGYADVLLGRIPELVGECISDRQMDAICELELRTLHSLADATAACPLDLAVKAKVLVARLVDDSAEVELPDGEAALLRSLLRDLSRLAEPTATVCATTTVPGPNGKHA